MTDCGVCMKPTVTPVIVTFEVPGIDAEAVAYCTECIVVVFEAMVKRYRESIEAQNEVVTALLRRLGVEGL
jgi:hypothetical protein